MFILRNIATMITDLLFNYIFRSLNEVILRFILNYAHQMHYDLVLYTSLIIL